MLSRLLPCSPLLIALLLAPARAASNIEALVDRPWLQVDTAHLRIVTDQPEEHARLMAVDLENLRYISSRVSGAASLEGKPLVIIAMGKPSFARVGLMDNIGGVFHVSRSGYFAIARIEGYDKQLDESNLGRSTLLHEYHHFLMHLGLDGLAYPAWYNEGMAEYWSSLTIRDGRAWFGHPVAGSYREAWLRGNGGGVLFRTEPLFNTVNLKLDDTPGANHELGRFYAQARYAVHYFNSTPELRRQLARYVELHNHGYSQQQAVQLAFGRSHQALDREMRVYVERKAVVRGFAIGKDGLDLPAVAPSVKRLDRAATYAALAQVLPRFTKPGNTVDKELIGTSLALNPNDPDAIASALLEPETAALVANPAELLKRYPAHGGLLAILAEGMRQHAFALRATGMAGWEQPLQQARVLFRQAVQADRDTSLAYYGLGHLYAALPEGEPAREAIECLDTAVLYEPEPASFVLLARMYLREREPALAAKTMRSAVAFRRDKDRPLDALMMENLELLAEAGSGAPGADGLVYKSGATYTGALLDGKPEGQGKWLRPNGSYYEGEFAGGLPSGRGRLVSEFGVAYEGQFQNGVARGAGRIAFPAGSRLVAYEGAVDYGVPSGAGVLTTRDGQLSASFDKGEAHGAGRFVPAQGAALEGRWLYGGFDWPAQGGVLFTGGINAKGQRDGQGWCRAADQPTRPAPCRYRDGKRDDRPDA